MEVARMTSVANRRIDILFSDVENLDLKIQLLARACATEGKMGGGWRYMLRLLLSLVTVVLNK
jgi:hypothetical protein